MVEPLHALRPALQRRRGGFIQYSLDCLVFQLRAAYINDFERIDRISERDNDFRISIMMRGRAHDRAPDDEWLTWYSLGCDSTR